MLAKKCSSQGYATYAVELYMLALRENPQNVTIRKIIGNTPFQNRWATRFEIKMIREGKVDHPDFGWIPQKHVAKYERGYRYKDEVPVRSEWRTNHGPGPPLYPSPTPPRAWVAV